MVRRKIEQNPLPDLSQFFPQMQGYGFLPPSSQLGNSEGIYHDNRDIDVNSSSTIIPWSSDIPGSSHNFEANSLTIPINLGTGNQTFPLSESHYYETGTPIDWHEQVIANNIDRNSTDNSYPVYDTNPCSEEQFSNEIQQNETANMEFTLTSADRHDNDKDGSSLYPPTGNAQDGRSSPTEGMLNAMIEFVERSADAAKFTDDQKFEYAQQYFATSSEFKSLPRKQQALFRQLLQSPDTNQMDDYNYNYEKINERVLDVLRGLRHHFNNIGCARKSIESYKYESTQKLHMLYEEAARCVEAILMNFPHSNRYRPGTTWPSGDKTKPPEETPESKERKKAPRALDRLIEILDMRELRNKADIQEAAKILRKQLKRSDDR